MDRYRRSAGLGCLHDRWDFHGLAGRKQATAAPKGGGTIDTKKIRGMSFFFTRAEGTSEYAVDIVIGNLGFY